MHLLTPTPPKTGCVSPTPRMALRSRKFLPTDGLPPPSMDHLASSRRRHYILREAFARFEEARAAVGMGKDSNVMIWLARKAFSAALPFPGIARRHRQEISGDVCVPRSLGKEWELDLKIEPCPTIDAVDSDLPPAARSAARKTEGMKWA